MYSHSNNTCTSFGKYCHSRAWTALLPVASTLCFSTISTRPNSAIPRTYSTISLRLATSVPSMYSICCGDFASHDRTIISAACGACTRLESGSMYLLREIKIATGIRNMSMMYGKTRAFHDDLLEGCTCGWQRLAPGYRASGAMSGIPPPGACPLVTRTCAAHATTHSFMGDCTRVQRHAVTMNAGHIYK